jgi:hypothetical protein
MKYAMPQLVVLGSVDALVLGVPSGVGDNSNPDFERSMADLVLGLDD